MSYEVRSLLHEFQCFLERLQFGVNRGLEVYSAITKIKKEIKIDYNAREVKIKVFAKFEIKEQVYVVLITFEIKKGGKKA
jgi:hypothetical protein